MQGQTDIRTYQATAAALYSNSPHMHTHTHANIRHTFNSSSVATSCALSSSASLLSGSNSTQPSCNSCDKQHMKQ